MLIKKDNSPRAQLGRQGLACGQVVRVNACHFTIGAARWAYADVLISQISAHWRAAQAANPGYFNGPIQVLVQHAIADGTLSGVFATTDFASFLYWRSQRHKDDDTVRDCFGCAVLRSAEGHMLLAVQAPGHLNSGRAYCPGGFIDTADITAAGTIDIDGSVARELAEETGLAAAELARCPGYILTAADASIAVGIEYRSTLPAEQLRAEILHHLAREATPELADIVIVRNGQDLAGLATANYVPALVAAILPRQQD